ncbi:unnamed protein product, partial [Prorocentrum cordatum]
MADDDWGAHINGLIAEQLGKLLPLEFKTLKDDLATIASTSAADAAGKAVDPVMAAVRALENAIKAVPGNCKNEMEAHLRLEVNDLEQRIQRQLDTMAAKINDVDARTETLAKQFADMQNPLEEMRKELAMANKVPQPPKPAGIGFQRNIDGTILKAVAPTMVCKKEVVASVEKLLQDAKIDGFNIEGDEQDRIFVIQFTSAVGLACKRVSQALAALRLGQGQWMRFPVPAASGGSTQLRSGPDKSPHQIKLEIAGKKVTNVLRQEHPQCKFFFDRHNGWLSENWNPVLRLEPQPGRDPALCHFHDVALTSRGWTRAGIDKSIGHILKSNAASYLDLLGISSSAVAIEEDTKTVSQIDALWLSEPNWMSRQLQHPVSVTSTPEGMRAKELADHAAIRVHIRHRDLEGCYWKPVPAHIFKRPEFRRRLSALLVNDGQLLLGMSPPRQLLRYSDLVQAAALDAMQSIFVNESDSLEAQLVFVRQAF